MKSEACAATLSASMIQSVSLCVTAASSCYQKQILTWSSATVWPHHDLRSSSYSTLPLRPQVWRRRRETKTSFCTLRLFLRWGENANVLIQKQTKEKVKDSSFGWSYKIRPPLSTYWLLIFLHLRRSYPGLVHSRVFNTEMRKVDPTFSFCVDLYKIESVFVYIFTIIHQTCISQQF